jgi:hypothetical protein
MKTENISKETLKDYPCDICGKPIKDYRNAVIETTDDGIEMKVEHAECYFKSIKKT